jgi:hypothetical protein
MGAARAEKNREFFAKRAYSSKTDAQLCSIFRALLGKSLLKGAGNFSAPSREITGSCF